MVKAEKRDKILQLRLKKRLLIRTPLVPYWYGTSVYQVQQA